MYVTNEIFETGTARTAAKSHTKSKKSVRRFAKVKKIIINNLCVVEPKKNYK